MACSHATADLNFIILIELYYTFILVYEYYTVKYH